MPWASLTRAIFRRAEFGFFGVTVATRVQTPLRCGAATFFLLPWPDLRPGVATFFFGRLRPLRTSWFVFGTTADLTDAAAGRPRRDPCETRSPARKESNRTRPQEARQPEIVSPRFSC